MRAVPEHRVVDPDARVVEVYRGAAEEPDVCADELRWRPHAGNPSW